MRIPNKHYFATLKGKQVIVTPDPFLPIYWIDGMSFHPAEDFEWIDETSVEDLRAQAEYWKKLYEATLKMHSWYIEGRNTRGHVKARAEWQALVNNPPESTESTKKE